MNHPLIVLISLTCILVLLFPTLDGTDILFDDTYTHSARNLTDNTRVVLFLDIKRQFNNLFIQWFNSTFLYCAQFNSTVNNIIKNS
jgi:beta-hydroxylase